MVSWAPRTVLADQADLLAGIAAVIGFLALPAVASAAATTTVTLSVSSTVDAPPGTCLLSSSIPPDSTVDATASSFKVTCSGSVPYFVTLDGTTAGSTPLSLAGNETDLISSRSAGGEARTFKLSGSSDAANPGRSALHPITAIVQY